MDKNKEIQIRSDIYWFLWVVQRLLDEGKAEDIDKIVNECDNGTIFEYIFKTYEIGEKDNPFNIESRTINYLYANVGFDKAFISRKYNVYSNGLIYLSVIAIEWLYTGFSHLYQ